MSATLGDIERITALARFLPAGAENQRFTTKPNAVTDFMEQVKRVGTSGRNHSHTSLNPALFSVTTHASVISTVRIPPGMLQRISNILQRSQRDRRPMSTNRKDQVVVVIPARYAAQRLPGKPLADIGGKPMIQHVYERAARATLVHAVVVATDDERIASSVRAFGGHVTMTPENCRSGTDRVAFTAKNLKDVAIVINVQGDEPLIEPSMIDEAVRPLLSDPSIPVGTLVRKIAAETDLANPNVVKVVLDREGRCLYFSRSIIPFGRDRATSDWLGQHVFYKHIGLYVFRYQFLLHYLEMPQTPLEKMEKLEQLRILEHGHTIKAAVTMYDSIPVDTPDDLERVRALVAKTP